MTHPTPKPKPLTLFYTSPHRRKKKCIRYMEAGDGNDGNQSDDNLGSCGSMGDVHTPPEDDAESLSQSMSSPGGLSGLSSLTSPGGMVLPSPSTSVASPSVASPYMLQSPLTPHEAFDVRPQRNALSDSFDPRPTLPRDEPFDSRPTLPRDEPFGSRPTLPRDEPFGSRPALPRDEPFDSRPLQRNAHEDSFDPRPVPLPRNPVGTNPHDINNPLSVNQLTGQCVKTDSAESGGKETARSIISVT